MLAFYFNLIYAVAYGNRDRELWHIHPFLFRDEMPLVHSLLSETMVHMAFLITKYLTTNNFRGKHHPANILFSSNIM